MKMKARASALARLCAVGLLAFLAGGATGCMAQSGTQTATPPAATSVSTAAHVNGTWVGVLRPPDDAHQSVKFPPITLNLEVVGNVVTGTLAGGPPKGETQPLVNGKLIGNDISFDIEGQGRGGDPLTFHYTGTVDGNRITGSQTTPRGTLIWEVTRQ